MGGVASRWFVYGDQRYRSGRVGERNEDRLALEGRPDGIFGGETIERSGEEAFGIHLVPDFVVDGKNDREGSFGRRGGSQGEEEEDGERSLARVGDHEQTKADLDEKPGGDHEGRIRRVLQVADERLGRTVGGEALRRGRSIGIQIRFVRPEESAV